MGASSTKDQHATATLEDVTAAMIDAYFVPRGVDELAFPAREG